MTRFLALLLAALCFMASGFVVGRASVTPPRPSTPAPVTDSSTFDPLCFTRDGMPVAHVPDDYSAPHRAEARRRAWAACATPPSDPRLKRAYLENLDFVPDRLASPVPTKVGEALASLERTTTQGLDRLEVAIDAMIARLKACERGAALESRYRAALLREALVPRTTHEAAR